MLALRDPDETAESVGQFKATHRAQGRTKSKSTRERLDEEVQKHGFTTPKAEAEPEEEEEEEEEDVLYGSADEYESE